MVAGAGGPLSALRRLQATRRRHLRPSASRPADQAPPGQWPVGRVAAASTTVTPARPSPQCQRHGRRGPACGTGAAAMAARRTQLLNRRHGDRDRLSTGSAGGAARGSSGRRRRREQSLQDRASGSGSTASAPATGGAGSLATNGATGGATCRWSTSWAVRQNRQPDASQAATSAPGRSGVGSSAGAAGRGKLQADLNDVARQQERLARHQHGQRRPGSAVERQCRRHAAFDHRGDRRAGGQRQFRYHQWGQRGRDTAGGGGGPVRQCDCNTNVTVTPGHREPRGRRKRRPDRRRRSAGDAVASVRLRIEPVVDQRHRDWHGRRLARGQQRRARRRSDRRGQRIDLFRRQPRTGRHGRR